MTTCSQCRFWKRIDPGRRIAGFDDVHMSDEEDDKFLIGECLRYPPKISDREIAETLKAPLYSGSRFASLPVSVICSATLWPITWDSDGCGEFSWKTTEQCKAEHDAEKLRKKLAEAV